MMVKNDSPMGLFTLSIIVSILIHIFLFWISTQNLQWSPSETINKPETEVQWINLQNQFNNRKVVDVIDDKSIVETAVDSKYLSDQNRIVERPSLSAPSLGNPSSKPSMTSSTDSSSLNLSDQKLASILSQTETPHTISFNPSNYLPEIEAGDQTMLSTQKFAYATYFNRMKRDIQAYWRPPGSTIRHNPQKKMWVSKMLIVLNDQGELVKQQIISGSGATQLDQHALTAVAKAAPFYNPPEVLLDESNEIRMTWHFIFETSRF